MSAPFYCAECEDPAPHDHGMVWGQDGAASPAIIYRSDRHPRAEVRDSETGEVIFPAVKGPLQVIRGGHDL